MLCLIHDDSGEVVWGSNESQVFAGLRIPSENPFDNAGIFNLGSFVLTAIDSDEIAIGYLLKKLNGIFPSKRA
jgi:hypothetical protein